jgi:hypothetical protein
LNESAQLWTLSLNTTTPTSTPPLATPSFLNGSSRRQSRKIFGRIFFIFFVSVDLWLPSSASIEDCGMFSHISYTFIVHTYQYISGMYLSLCNICICTYVQYITDILYISVYLWLPSSASIEVCGMFSYISDIFYTAVNLCIADMYPWHLCIVHISLPLTAFQCSGWRSRNFSVQFWGWKLLW